MTQRARRSIHRLTDRSQQPSSETIRAHMTTRAIFFHEDEDLKLESGEREYLTRQLRTMGGNSDQVNLLIGGQRQWAAALFVDTQRVPTLLRSWMDAPP